MGSGTAGVPERVAWRSWCQLAEGVELELEEAALSR